MVQSTLKQQLHDAELEVKEQAEKHKEILQYSQSLAENNASSKASVAELQAKVCVQWCLDLEEAQQSYRGIVK